MKKVNVANFPNVFNLQSVLLEHTADIKDMCLLGNDRMATLSEPNPTSKENELIISTLKDATIIFKMSSQGVSQIAATSKGTLLLLKEDGSATELTRNQSKMSEYIEHDASTL